MIDEKRLAEIRDKINHIVWMSDGAISPVELLELVECYEAARAYAHWAQVIDHSDTKLTAETIDAMDAAEIHLYALFPEATNG